ncbi:MAG: hypothetical protein B7X04_04135 [Parcubacteria group bacterium 21-54-25]|nr:MAG: hypothetical protein B7X04_04135 [Parcubacteria group bacterium 21-54-25]HQU08313.1 RpiB/LacA/LacB family sugar-phosphate isomerase [Candidatus Paceibacterota bacterium]
MSSNPATSNIYLAADHAGFALKNTLVAFLRARGYTVEDLGAHDLSPEDDYPDFVTPCAKRVAQENPRTGAAQVFGIVIGGSGQGEAMAANRVPGVRAAVFYGDAHAPGTVDAEGTPAAKDGLDIIRLTRAHNDANVLSFGARFVSDEEAERAALLFLSTPFSGGARHIRRISKY